MQNGDLEEKLHYSEHVPPFLLLPAAFIAEHDIVWYGKSLWSVGVSCPGCAPSQLSVHLHPTRGRVRSRQGLGTV